jgi:ribulose-5-phosphate 4-epimerase/fuculose-1-phosphate aldolase
MCLPVTRREEPFGSISLVRRVLEMLGDHTFVVMRNHGFLALGADMESAGGLALRVHDECLR